MSPNDVIKLQELLLEALQVEPTFLYWRCKLNGFLVADECGCSLLSLIIPCRVWYVS